MLSLASLLLLLGTGAAGLQTDSAQAVAAARAAAIRRARTELEATIDRQGGFEAIDARLTPFRERVLAAMDSAEPPGPFWQLGRFWFHKRCDGAALLAAWTPPDGASPIDVVRDFSRKLREKGVDLIFVPVPAKIECYASEVAAGLGTELELPAEHPISPARDRAMLALLAADVEVVDVLPLARSLTAPGAEGEGAPSFELGSHHLSGLAVARCGELVAERLERYSFEQRHKEAYSQVKRSGQESRLPNPMEVWEVLKNGEPYRAGRKAPIVVIGDSHANVFGSASWASHIARSSGVPVLDKSSKGGAHDAHLRLLKLDPNFWEKHQVVIWIFTSGSMALDSWQTAPDLR